MFELRSKARAFAIATLPESVVRFIRGCRYRGYLAHVQYRLKSRIYRNRYAKANATAPEATIVFPAQCLIRVPSDTDDVREFFDTSDGRIQMRWKSSRLHARSCR